MKPFTLDLGPTRVAKISRNGCSYTIEPMRFLTPSEAKMFTGHSFDTPPICDQTPWCPKEHKPLYRRLRQKGLSAKEARPLVEETIAKRSTNVLVSGNREKGHRI